MMSETTRKNLEARYNCRISIDRFCGLFRIYSMDGCPWDKAGSYRALISTLAKDKESLKRIAERRVDRKACPV